ncbi:MAG: hypothetical protein KJ950_17400 [Proteobacteria bacterium]|nr:hypothetical protein [Pseudomonadota bacterium]MBU1689036.1 hypothetical protein [Pseudomonadota bacterium]
MNDLSDQDLSSSEKDLCDGCGRFWPVNEIKSTCGKGWLCPLCRAELESCGCEDGSDR